MKRGVLLLLAAAAPSVSALELTWDNAKILTAGKHLFLEFYAPW